MQSDRAEKLLAVYRDGLLEDTLPFWLTHALDRRCGGYITSLGRDGTVLDTDKGMWQQGRFAWLLGHLYNNVEARPEWLDAAKLGIDFLLEHGFASNGQMLFLATREGLPLRRRRYAFGEAFAAMALAEYAKAVGSDEHASRSRQLLENFRTFHGNAERTGFAPKFEPTRPVRGIGEPMIQIGAAQILRDCLGDDGDTGRIDRCIETIERLHVKPDIECVMETVGPNGEIVDHFDGRTLNPGHAIEAAWFILHEARLRDNDARLIALGSKMLDWMWRRGWDAEYGGMLYFRDVRGLPVQEYWHDMKFWWPHNETITATLLAHVLTGDEKYAQWHRQVHDWAYAHFPDPECGEWFGYLHRDGGLSVPLKGNLWKGPFHLPRMQLRCWQMLTA